MDERDRIEAARLLYERAVFDGDATALDRADSALDSVEAELSLARGQVLHGRHLADRREGLAEAGVAGDELALFERSASLCRRSGDQRGEARALLWMGIFQQVLREDNATAAPLLTRAAELATLVGDRLTLSYVLRHQGITEHLAGDLGTARELLEHSTRLRRELGFSAGVAANLVGLSYIALGQGRAGDAAALLDEAGTLADDRGALAIADQVRAARKQLTD